MRLTDHETTPSRDDIPPERPTALVPPDPSLEDDAARNAAGTADMGERSSQASDIQHARAVAQAAPEVRQEKVEAARRALLEDTLTLDGQTLAEKLLQASRTDHLPNTH
jgi:anti-sigma28 factor (negative regulator of flagellin synthesis)